MASTMTQMQRAATLSAECGRKNQSGIFALACAAALEDVIHALEDGPGGSTGAAIIWTFCRALCHECGIDFDHIRNRAREWADTQ